MRTPFVMVLPLVLGLGFPRFVHAAPGDLDPTFDGDGIVTTALPGVTLPLAQTAVLQPDGKLVVAVDGTTDVTVLRYRTDGTLDPDFDGDGIVSTAIGTTDRALGVALQSDGRIVVVGDTSSGGNTDVVVVRYDDDGTLDTSFDTDGIVTTPIGAGTDSATCVRVQGDGKIVVAGRAFVAGNFDVAVVRYDDGGALDTSFDMDGKVTTSVGPSDAVEDLAIDPISGAITVVGNTSTSGTDLILVRYESDGSLDTGFDGDGIVSVNAGTSDFGYGVITGDAGGIFVAGFLNAQFSVLAYDATGTLDPAFAGDGIATVVFTPGGNEGATALVRQPDGKIVAAGGGGPAGNAAFALARFATDGTLDPTFGTGGKVTTEISAGSDAPFSLLRQTDGKLVAVGIASVGGIQIGLARYEGGDGPAATPTETPTPSATPTLTTTPTPTITATPPCAAAPVAGCRTPVQSAKSQLQAKDKSPDAKDQLQWKWSKGAVTSKDDFGVPTEPLAATSYQLCIYGDSAAPTPTLLYQATIAAGGTCDAAHPRDCWKETTHGYVYKDKDRLHGGVAQLSLKEGLSGSAKIQLKAGGAALDDPTFPFVQPVTVQLYNSDGICWESVHSAPATKNTNTPFGQFNDKAD